MLRRRLVREQVVDLFQSGDNRETYDIEFGTVHEQIGGVGNCQGFLVQPCFGYVGV